ncbi:aldehyde dehydrogenase family protein [Rhodococcus opacus]|uniref:aldehyde dehydrogenase family protein n=1 Tax=Rhodococcus opacus TaxID=37919 RepID=UPI0024B8D6A5|nr:aldehyde dehydrogenase family protein [Rhodococcus opacus]MDJ0414322.1 aldehyde dehydrogenase family protein [Rhodococcus opacus]
MTAVDESVQVGHTSLLNRATSGESPLYIDGGWQPSSDGRTFVDLDVTTRSQWSVAADGTVEDMDAAIAAATAAQPAWEALLPNERAAHLYRAAQVLEDNQEYYVDALIKESGSTRGKSEWECWLTAIALREAAALTSRTLGETYPSTVPGKRNYVERTAAGVVGVISPWNSPLYLSARGFIYAVALGNTAVVKPSEETPVTGGALLAELFEAAGFPSGILNVVSCSRDRVEAVADKLIKDFRVKRVCFTGSTAVGRKIGEACASVLKRAILEMGGKNPILVLDDADVDYAVHVAYYSAFLHQGQICMSCDKVIVAESLYQTFVDKLVAKASELKPLDPANPESVIGPIINDRQLERMERLIRAAESAGADILVGGTVKGAYYTPTVITGVTPDMEIYHEEIFGPATMVFRAKDETEAIQIANDTRYGLSAAVVTSDTSHGQVVARQIDAGMVHINDSCVHDEPHCPFGGMKDSGWVGKWGGAGAVEAFTEQRWISVQDSPRDFPF